MYLQYPDANYFHSRKTKKSGSDQFQNYSKEDDRLPPAYIADFWKDEDVFVSKKLFIVSNFSNVQSLLIFLPKKPHIWGGKDISKKRYHLIRISQQICHL